MSAIIDFIKGQAGNLLQLGGGALSDRQQRKENERDRALSREQFDRQMNESVQSRVRDATKAGIHPLFALGASVGASPTSISGGSPAGTGLGEAVKGIGTKMALEKLGASEIRRNEAAAARDEADAAFINSERKRLEGNLSSRGRDGASTVKTHPYPQPGPDVVYGPAELYNPEVKTSKRTGIASGTHPGRIEAIDEFGQVYSVPNPDLGMDEIGQIEFIIGLPSRVWKNIQGVRSKNAELKQIEADLTRARNARQNPRRAEEYRQLKARIKARLRAIYNQVKEYTQ